jgi:hypothetical protein
VSPSSWCWRIGKLVLPMNVFLIYIRKHSMVFSHLGFHVNFGILCILCDSVDWYCLWLYDHDILNEIINDILLIKLKFIYCD